MAFKDLREFLDKLEETGDLVKVKKEVHWNMEAPAIMRRCCENGLPAQLYENVKGHPGHKLLGQPLSTFRRLNIALGIDPDTKYKDILDLYNERFKKPIKPVQVSTGSCKENIIMGDDINLYDFPAPMLHDGDGGRYIGTWHVVCTKDPDTDWVNWGVYRLMIHNKNTLGGLLLPNQHIGRIFYEKYESRGKPMPVAIAIGTEPITTFIGSSSLNYGVSEVDIAGGMRQEPLELVKCETNDLLVPASSEIIIEAEIPPNIRVDEGPFGEYSGFRASPRAPRPVYRVTAITHRNNPILPCSCMGTPTTENDICWNISCAAAVRESLQETGLPVTGVYIPPEGSCLLGVIAVKTPYANVATQVAGAVWGSKGGQYLTKLIVVNDDFDFENIGEVVHELAAKCHPVRGIQVINQAVGNPLMPYLNLEERLWGKNSTVVFDCTWPVDWPQEIAVPPRASFRDIFPERIKEKVISNWKEYGLEEI